MTHQLSTHDTHHRFLSIAAAILLAAVNSVACSGSAQGTLPLAPSAVPSSSLSVEAPDGIDGWGAFGAGRGNDNDKGKGGESHAEHLEIKGIVATITGTCPTKTFVVGQHSIVTNALTAYEDGLCAQLVLEARVEVQAVRQADGTLLATEVEFDEADDDDDADDGIEVEGTVASAQGECPARSVVVGGRTVVTNATTVYRRGTCAQLEPGARVHVRGTLQTNGTVLASRADIRIHEQDDDDDTHRNPHHGAGPLEGTVSSFRGVCPTVTFNLKGTTIVTGATTTYIGGTCATLRPNVQVVVTGTPATARRTFNAATITITRTH